MLFLRSWLEDYIDLSDISNKDLTKKVTAFSMEVEEVKEISDYYGGLVVVGQINDPQPVEGSNKLRVFKVDLGDRHIQIVSAAPNVVDNMYVAVALSGAKLPRGYNIAERKMMGHVTQGMCLGKSELCLEEVYSSGLWEIEDELKTNSEKLKIKDFLGKPISELLPEYFPTETIFDIKVLPNSMGILSNHLGLAYELALVYKDFSILKPNAKTYLDFEKLSEQAEKSIELKVGQNNLSFSDNANYSHYFTMHELSLPDGEFVLPILIAQRMFLIEQNSVSPLVDISNYLVFDIGQPTHFFSKEKLSKLVDKSKIEITIDKLKENTPFAGLGHLKVKVLSADVAVIQAGGIPISLPGISGGVATSIDHDEKELYLEIATFDPEEVAKNSFKLGFDRSAATRVFAGGVPSIKLLITLIRLKEILGDKIDIKSLILAGKDGEFTCFDEFTRQLKLDFETEIELDLGYLSSKISTHDLTDPIFNTLTNLGKIKSSDGNKVVFIPNKLYTSYEVKEDVIADLARFDDLTHIYAQSLNIAVSPEIDLTYRPLVELKKAVSGLGFTETINRPFISPEILENLPNGKEKSILILNPIRSQEPYNRTGLIESLLQTTRRNLDSGQPQVNIFELNKVYTKIKPNNDPKILKIIPTIQTRRLLGILTTELSMQELTSVMHEILAKIKQTVSGFTGFNDELALNGFSVENDQIKIKIYQLNNSTKKKFGISLSKNVNYLEFDLSNWDNSFNPYQTYREDREFPDLKRSLSFFVSQNVLFGSVKSLIEDLEMIKKLDLEVVVEGLERIAGSRSTDEENPEQEIISPDILNISIKLNHPSRTITGVEADEIEAAILADLQGKLDGGISRR